MSNIYFLLLSGATIFFGGSQIKSEAPRMGWDGIHCQTTSGELRVLSDVATLSGDTITIEIKNDTIWITNK